MKTRSLLIIVVFAFTTHVFAAEIPKMNVIVLDKTRALVAVTKSDPGKTIISFESEDGNIVYYKETSKQADFKTVLDLREIKNGTYQVTAKTGNRIMKRNIICKDGEISVESMKTEYDPVFVFNQNKLRVSYLNFDQTDFRFLVYKNGDLVYDYNMGNDVVMQKKFDLSRLNRGDYEIALASEGKEYSYWVNK